jgi:hypothetical protein
MFIKEYNTNRYVFVKYDDFACKRNFYDEMMRIQYNKVYTHPNEIETLERILKQPKKNTRTYS